MLRNTGPFKLIEGLPTKITIDGDEIGNTVSIDRTTMAPLVEYTGRQPVYTRDQAVDKRCEKFDKGGEQNTAELRTTPGEYTIHFIGRHGGKGDKVQYVVNWYGFIFADETFEQTEHIHEYFTSRY